MNHGVDQKSANAGPALGRGLFASGLAIMVNGVLAVIKITTGLVGNSYALVADGIESTADIFSSIVVWSGIKISSRPPDSKHPYGHGKAESIAGVVVALFLLGAAALIATQSIREIQTPHHTPEWYTLIVLGIVIATKGSLSRFVFKVGSKLHSISLKGDAWHHRSDAITSSAAFVGISVALIGGDGYEAADDWAALLACVVIVYNGIHLLRPAMDEVMDAAAPKDVEDEVRRVAKEVAGVVDVEKCRIRKSGVSLLMDIHVIVDGDTPVKEGHRIGHVVKERLEQSPLPIHDVVVHIEPDGF